MIATKFQWDDLVTHRLTEEDGIIDAITYQTPDFYVYTVLFGDRVRTCKEVELESKTEIY